MSRLIVVLLFTFVGSSSASWFNDIKVLGQFVISGKVPPIFFPSDDGSVTEISINPPPPQFSPEMKGVPSREPEFLLYTKENRKDPINLSSLEENLPKIQEKLPKFNRDAFWKILCHGFQSSAKNPFPFDIMQTYLDQSFDYSPNVILVDWSSIAKSPFYHYAADSTDLVGNRTAELIYKLLGEDIVIDLTKVHVIGHSLGAHVAGLTGSKLANIVGKKIGRITGLDPAGPQFCVNENERLDPDDALFVDIIHTNDANYCGYAITSILNLSKGKFGLETPIGHVDFYPNGGSTQPGCGKVLSSCSHSRSYYLLQESITNPKAFLARECSSWNYFIRGDCKLGQKVYMGEYTPKGTQGIFYLETGKSAPFSLT